MATQRQLMTTIRDYLRGEEKAMLRESMFGTLLESEGRIKTNASGIARNWKVRFDVHDMQANTGENELTFGPKNLWKEAELPWRGYAITDAVSLYEELINRGEPRIVDVYGGMAERLRESGAEGLASQWYINGSATGNEHTFHGLNSLWGTSATGDIADDAIANASGAITGTGSGELFGVTSATWTYAGIKTQPAAVGGSLPSGVGKANIYPMAYVTPPTDFWTPPLVNYKSSYLGGSAATWAEQGAAALRFLNLCLRRQKLPFRPNKAMLATDLWGELADKQETKERSNVSDNYGMRKYGFTDTFMYDGVEVCHEYHVPAGTGFVLNIKALELRLLGKRLWDLKRDNEIRTQHELFLIWCLGNLFIKQAKAVGKLTSLSSTPAWI